MKLVYKVGDTVWLCAASPADLRGHFPSAAPGMPGLTLLMSEQRGGAMLAGPEASEQPFFPPRCQILPREERSLCIAAQER